MSLRPDTDSLATLEATFAQLEREALDVLDALLPDFGPVSLHRQADGRFVGQAFHLTVDLPDGPYDSPEAIAGNGFEPSTHSASSASALAMRAHLHEAFVSGYRRKFGRTPPSVAVELVTLRVSALAPAREEGLLSGSQPDGEKTAPTRHTRPAYFPELGGFINVPVLRRNTLPVGFRATGPLLIEDAGSTLVLGPGADVALSPSGNLIVDLEPNLP